MGQVVEHLSPEFKPQYLQKKKKKTTKTQRKQVNHFSAGCIRGQLSSPPMPKAYWFRAKRVGGRSGVGVAEDGKMPAGEARRARRVEPEDLHHRDSAWL
jgi:hypothetical protein